jgi:hypothetical protein
VRGDRTWKPRDGGTRTSGGYELKPEGGAWAVYFFGRRLATLETIEMAMRFVAARDEKETAR